MGLGGKTLHIVAVMTFYTTNGRIVCFEKKNVPKPTVCKKNGHIANFGELTFIKWEWLRANGLVI